MLVLDCKITFRYFFVCKNWKQKIQTFAIIINTHNNTYNLVFISLILEVTSKWYKKMSCLITLIKYHKATASTINLYLQIYTIQVQKMWDAYEC